MNDKVNEEADRLIELFGEVKFNIYTSGVNKTTHDMPTKQAIKCALISATKTKWALSKGMLVNSHEVGNWQSEQVAFYSQVIDELHKRLNNK